MKYLAKLENIFFQFCHSSGRRYGKYNIAIQFDPIFGKTKMSNGDWVTTIGRIEAISRISKLAAIEAITRLGAKGE
ncbi:MAG: hypothetical protein M3O03_15280 [Pseudomonadota bacterium]|nr:hypothetical protein [Pseudomonadota bacterium]